MPMEGNIVNIEHGAMILHKIVLTCSKAHRQKMKPRDLKETSVGLLKIVNYLFGYLRNTDENHRTVNIERVDRITK